VGDPGEVQAQRATAALGYRLAAHCPQSVDLDRVEARHPDRHLLRRLLKEGGGGLSGIVPGPLLLEHDLHVAVFRERPHGATRVQRLPAIREDERQIEVRMHETLAVEHPLGGILAQEQALEPVQKAVAAAGDGGPRRPLDLLRPPGGL